MNAINKTVCELGLRRDIDGLTWEDVGRQAGLAEEGVTDLAEGARSRYRYWIGHYLEEELGFDAASGDHRNPDVRASWSEKDNTLEVSYSGPLISSLDELVKHLVDHGVDMGEWVVSDWECKAYPAWCADRQADLTWENGRITEGTVKQSGDVTIRQVFSVSAEFIRKDPITVRPVLQPIQLAPFDKSDDHLTAPVEGRNTKLWLCAGDAHIGFKRKGVARELVPLHDRRALSLFVQAVALLQPDGIVFGGDWLDLAEWSTKFVRSPQCVDTTQPALIEFGYWARRVVGALGLRREHVDLEYLEGNHEVRFRHFIHKHMAHACDLRPIALTEDGRVRLEDDRALSLRRWTDLDTLGIKWNGGYPDSGVWLSDWIRVEHGDRALSSGHTAKEQSRQSEVNVVFFHIHRRERVSHTVYSRGVNKEVTAMSPGGLMHTDGRLPGATPRDQWQQGFVILEFDPDRPDLEPIFQTVPIRMGQCILRGRRLVGDEAGAISHLQGHHPQYFWAR